MSAPALSPPAIVGAALRTSMTRPQLSRCAGRLTQSTNSHSYATTESESTTKYTPRWAATPSRMAMPVRARPGPRQRQSAPFVVNEDASLLDTAYNSFLGKNGDTILPEEIKWLAVTHKSFDHARRGFNDKLAFLGKTLCNVQCSLALLEQPSRPEDRFPVERIRNQHKSYAHPAMRGLHHVSDFAKQQTLSKERLASLARQYGLNAVVRWKPRNVDNLSSSGVDVVLAHTLYSIVGAVAMEKGGEFANKIVRERILNPLGLK
ncbi:RNase III domain protein [Aureobasidium sp. EXF-3400]|nr:RNase III domain protein [Aureobasidium sp. EXF-12344]KAI4778043.1 RNase III domain protein [Aureobasidium sp. EXF-3400]